jgi:hypothetical protein
MTPGRARRGRLRNLSGIFWNPSKVLGNFWNVARNVSGSCGNLSGSFQTRGKSSGRRGK